MLRNKYTFLGAAGVLLAGTFGFANSATAAAPAYNTSAASVTCNSLVAVTATLKPPLTTASTGTGAIALKGTLLGCTSTGATLNNVASEPTIVSGSVSGTVTTAGAGGCAGLATPSTLTGNLKASWKVASGQKLDFSSTTLTGGTISAGPYVGPGGVLYGQFSLTGQTFGPKSAFIGGTPITTAVTSEDITTLLGLCGAAPPGPGVKTIHLGVGNLVG